jgi:hypothetical protein
MIVLNSCIRCHGDVHLKNDHYGQFLSCLQCGAVTDVPERIEIASFPDIA